MPPEDSLFDEGILDLDHEDFLCGLDPSAVEFDVFDMLKDFMTPDNVPSPSAMGNGEPARGSSHISSISTQRSCSTASSMQDQHQAHASNSMQKNQGAATGQKRPRIRIREVDKIRNLEALYQQKMQEYQTLAARNSMLSYKRKTLEMLVGLRDYQVSFVAENISKVAPITERSISGGALGDAPAQSPPGSLSDLLTLSEADPSSKLRISDVAKSYLATLDPCKHITLISHEEFADRWRHFLANCSSFAMLMQSEALSPELTGKLADLVAPMVCMCRNTSLLNPGVMEVVLRTPLDPTAPRLPDPEHWRMVLRVLELSREQRCQLMAAYDIYRQIMGKVAQEGEVLKREMDIIAQGSLAAGDAPPHVELVARLQRNVKKVMGAHVLLRGFLFARILNIKQFVFLCAYSFPYFPDATAIIEVLWADSQLDAEQS